MQLASSGLRALRGGQAHFFPISGGPRSIHIPAFARRHPPSQPSTAARAMLRNPRGFLSSFFAHLTTPGTLRSPVHSATASTHAFRARSMRMPTIQERSFPTRNILAKPLSVPFLPRPPTVPRHVAQVGLGSARNFSSTRPIFQHLVENVPIYARAFSEVDLDTRVQDERERLRTEKHKAKRAKKVKAPLGLRTQNVVGTPAMSTLETEKGELDHYFSEPPAPEVVTYLLIPLAPTPTSRLPLPMNPSATSSARPLLPLDVIASLHSSHSNHALRVSTVFARLDMARVFDEPGIHCEARGDPSGLCTVLEVRFEGWTVDKVRGVLGEAGTGWCVLEEILRDQDHLDAEQMDQTLERPSATGSAISSEISSPGSSDMNPSWDMTSDGIDPAQSLILPMLDFSFPVPSWSRDALSQPPITTPALSDLEFYNAWLPRDRPTSSPPEDLWSDSDSEIGSMTSDWLELSRPPSSTDRPFMFSSQFTERMDGPHEELF